MKPAAIEISSSDNYGTHRYRIENNKTFLIIKSSAGMDLCLSEEDLARIGISLRNGS